MKQINYAEINARAVNMILSAKKHISTLDAQLKTILELRVSQINGCAYCLDLHSKEARSAGVTQQKLDCLSAAAESGLFTLAEVSALRWAELLTNIQSAQNHDEFLDDLFVHYNEAEVVDLTLTIALMNCLNRIAISMGDRPA